MISCLRINIHDLAVLTKALPMPLTMSTIATVTAHEHVT